MDHKRTCLIAITVILLLLIPSLSAKQVSQWEWKGIERVVAIGDIHGLYDYLESLLKGTELIDEELAWIGGTDHLVLCGDILDRGKKERKIVSLPAAMSSGVGLKAISCRIPRSFGIIDSLLMCVAIPENLPSEELWITAL